MKILNHLYHKKLDIDDAYDAKYDFAIDVIIALGLERSCNTTPFGDEFYASDVVEFIDTIEAAAKGRKAYEELDDALSDGKDAEKTLTALLGKRSDA